ncbi:MAG: hypothetical protein IIB95_00930 [Candidatus Marinimicrobia bacterium]|nr:hypothetical protein [Candidatus Neomarinimicrobiota bacterium]MCH7762288.1 hypothetical protein [Candidatus Neomarinimicrobiota bacterium]
MVTVLPHGKDSRQYIWSPGSKTIAYRLNTWEKGIRISADLHTFDIQSKHSSLLKEEIPPFRFARWTNEGIEAIRGITRQKNKEREFVKPAITKIINVTSGELRQSNNPIVYHDQIDNKHFVIVEDGELIIYQIGEAGGFHGQTLIGSEIFVININGTDKNQLTHTPDIIEMKPHWSGSSLKITYFDYLTGTIFVSELKYKE